MRYKNKLVLLVLITAFIATAAVSAAVGFSAGVANGSNMQLAYPSFYILASRPSAPAPQEKNGIERYEREGKEYVEAAERYLNNVLEDINRISAEGEIATNEVNSFIDEYNEVMRNSY